MSVIENRDEWEEKFTLWGKEAIAVIEEGDVKKAFSTYPFVVNSSTFLTPPSIDLKEGRIALISSSGAFVVENQEPFDSTNPLGDPSFRTVPKDTDVNHISFRHERYSKEYASSDPDVVFPLWLLKTMEKKKALGQLFSPVLSFSGYLPNPAYFIDTTGKEFYEILKRGDVDFVLLILV